MNGWKRALLPAGTADAEPSSLWSDPLAGIRHRVIVAFTPGVVLIVSPFLVWHGVRGQLLYCLAGLCLLAALLVTRWLIQRGKLPEPVLVAQALAGNGMLVAAIYVGGSEALPWLGMMVMANYFLVPRKYAHVLNAILLPMTCWIEFLLVGERSVGLRVAGASALTLLMLNIVLTHLDNAQREIAVLAEIDPLTGAGNRRRFDRFVAKLLISRPEPICSANTLLAIDIDHFKSINDRHGHSVGDEVIRGAAQRIRDRLRMSDHLFRTGGEEFLVLLPRTGAKYALQLAEDIRRLFDQQDIVAGVRITISVGVCEQDANLDVLQWQKAADQALYVAKREGRNRVVVWRASMAERSTHVFMELTGNTGYCKGANDGRLEPGS